MFRCSDKKLDWYLRIFLAELILVALYEPQNRGVSQTIRLLFEPRGTGRNRSGDERYLGNQQDRCVVCGREGDIDDRLETEPLHENGVDGLDISCLPRNLIESAGNSVGLALHHVVHSISKRDASILQNTWKSRCLALCVDDHEVYEHFADSEVLKLVDKMMLH